MGMYTFRISNERPGRDAPDTAENHDRQWDVVTDVSFETIGQAVDFTDVLSVYWRHVQVSKGLGEVWLERHR